MANVIKTYYRGDEEVEGEYTLIRFKYSVDADGVAVATWAQPEKLNPLSDAVKWELDLILEHVERDPAVLVLVLTNEGRAFSSGAAFSKDTDPTVDKDVMEGYVKRGKGHHPSDFALKGLVMRCLNFPKFFITAINGLAVGGSVNIGLLLPDHVIVSESAKFRYPFSELGIPPEVSSALVLPQLIGMARAKELLLLGPWFDGREAHRLGLCNAVLPDSEVLPRAMQVAKSVAGMGPAHIRRCKALLHRAPLKEMDGHMDAENTAFADALQSPETQALWKAAVKRVTKVKSNSKL